MKWSERLGFGKRKVKTDGLFIKCKSCDNTIYKEQLKESHLVCPECGFYMTMGPSDRVGLLIDDGTFVEHDETMQSVDPLSFEAASSYADTYERARKKTGSQEAVVYGEGKLSGIPVVLAVMDFNFIGGSMGSVLGEKITRAAELATKQKVALIVVTASGGARMHEGALSLMQMAKTSAALARHKEAGLPFISIMTHPTMGGVTASFATLGDIIIAEPKALIGFAGPRVIEQTFKKKLPEGFQSSEFLMEHGHIDMIVERSDMKSRLTQIIDYLAPQTVPEGAGVTVAQATQSEPENSDAASESSDEESTESADA